MAKKIYMGGICGMGMAPLACFLKADLQDVCGFDDCPNPDILKILDKYDVELSECPEKIDKLIISTSLKNRKKELFDKFQVNEIISRGKAWSQICNERKLVAVIGSHGKSTVSALIAHAINKYQLDAGFMVGAIPMGFDFFKYCKKNELIFSEIDESDATIEYFNPEISLALNADLDHTDTYKDEEALKDMFIRLFQRTKKLVFYPEDDKILSQVAKDFPDKSFPLNLTGNFIQRNKIIALNALNYIFKSEFKIDIFDDFKGLYRRQEVIIDNEKLYAISDYAHHPKEVDEFLSWFINKDNNEKLVIFQPHRYTRTKYFADEFKKILNKYPQAQIYIMPIYSASEIFDESISSNKILENTNFSFLDNGKIKELIKSKLTDKKISIAMIGAGDAYFEFKNFLRNEN